MSALEPAPDTWFQELSIEFEDGSAELLRIERKPTGTHILRGRPEPWTKLSFHKCPCCPLPEAMLTCPAARSLQTTMSELRSRKSYERVKASAVDIEGRSQTVEWDLQSVGSTLVQLAVFASGCPVGRKLKPYLKGLPPFVDTMGFSRHIAAVILKKHGGSADAAGRELGEVLTPLHEVFLHLTRRIGADQQERSAPEQGEESAFCDAVPNSITQADAFAQGLAMRADRLFSEITAEVGWAEAEKPAPAAPASGGWLRRLFGG